ncbi:hypothetical protein BDN72DRAFT_893183 [Pluteus cervinus]|uniref:Uncharacterized protein n=1 Tax=Pluteus cervinus TaxID=181527 RepID=A0ACD3B8Y8_9AGAR|nr:hypothetical protein BDN72DRAFT_893183 [Pluteus cervinus]
MVFDMLRSIFCGCFGKSKESSHQDVIDETSRLIPQILEPPSPHPSLYKQQRLQERLDTIVRSKEGKMVNVNSPLPFNLHNRVRQGSNHRHTLSRSTSGSLDIFGVDPYHHPTPIVYNQPSPTASPSPSPRGNLSKSRSQSPVEGECSESRRHSQNYPILGLRLVHLDEVRSESTHAATSPSSDEEDAELQLRLAKEALELERLSETPRARPTIPASPHISVGDKPEEGVDTMHLDFHDVGSLTMSWGD